MTKRRMLYFIIPLIVIIFLLPLFKVEYATDTYWTEISGFHLTGDHMLNNNGRPVTAMFLYLFGALSLNVTTFYYFSFFLAIISASFAIYRLYRILKEHMSIICALFLSVMTVLTPLCTEYFLFVEKGFFLFAICMVVLALEGFILFIKGKKLGLLLALPTILLASLTYQIIPGAFAILATLFSILYSNKSVKALIKSILIAVGIYGFGVGTCVLFVKLFTTSNRVGVGIDFANLFNCVFFLGPKTLLIYIPIIAVLFLVCLLINKAKNKKCFTKELGYDFASCMLIFLAGMGVTFAPAIVITPMWYTVRTLYPLSIIVLAIAIYFCYRKEYVHKASIKELFDTKAKKIGAIFMVIILSLNLAFYYVLFIGRLINNAKDESLVQKIGEEIELYEKENSTEIKYIKIYYDENKTNCNKGVLKIGDTNVRAFSKTWSDVNHMNVILDKNYKKKKADDKIYKKYFEGKDWDTFSPDQLVFDGETLHLCVY